MKIKTKEIEQPSLFNPFDLVLTIESRQELETLWVLSNVLSIHSVVDEIKRSNKGARISSDSFNVSFLTLPLFSVIDAKLSEVNNEQL